MKRINDPMKRPRSEVDTLAWQKQKGLSLPSFVRRAKQPPVDMRRLGLNVSIICHDIVNRAREVRVDTREKKVFVPYLHVYLGQRLSQFVKEDRLVYLHLNYGNINSCNCFKYITAIIPVLFP